MSENTTQENKDVVASTKTTDELNSKTSLHRRALVKGAVGTLPMVLTLQSGAALARSSNLITTTTSPAAAKNGYGQTLCLDTDSVEYVGDGGRRGGETYDGGDPVYARVETITERDYYVWKQGEGFASVSEDEICLEGGTYFYRGRFGMQQVNAGGAGGLVSAVQLTSFADKINFVDI